MLKKILIVLALAVAALVAVIATRPATYRVERSTDVDAGAAAVFGLVDDFHQWERWSPWEHLDPAMKKTFEGPAAGKGASYHWAGNDDVGEGRMTITESREPESLAIELQFIAPWEATNQTTFRFDEKEGRTHVTWTMEGNNDFVGKAFSLFMDMDAMIGGDFEKGLANLKALAEAGEAAPAG